MAMEYKQEELDLPGTETGERWYTVTEMAKMVGVHPVTIRYRIKKIDTSSHIRHIRTKENCPVCVFDEYVFKYVSTKHRLERTKSCQKKKTVIKNESALKHESETTNVKQEKGNLQVTESDYKWYTIRQMAEIVGISCRGMESRLRKLDTTSHKKYIRSKDNRTRMVVYDEYIFKLVSYPPLETDHIYEKEVVKKYENEIERLKQEMQREKNKRTECLEKYSKHLDYIVSIKNEYSSMQRQIADLTAENNELKAELARKPVWHKLFA